MAALINLENPLIDKMDAILPQTQCRQCGYQGCKPYAVAIANREANINQCPPGGDAGIQALARLTGMQYLPLNTAHGEYKSKALAVIDETVCIGCTLCIQACPVDAILGANKQMHTVIAAECTGCELCIAPCPVDCISMKPLQATHPLLNPLSLEAKQATNVARTRYTFRLARIEQDKVKRAQQYAERRQATNKSFAVPENITNTPIPDLPAPHDKKAAIAAAIARAHAMKNLSK
jgi:electron transport complex protein RnfB